MKTTAEYRKIAAAHEKNLQWALAAEAWNNAINVYPCNGALAELDIKRMTEHRDACKVMSQ